MSRLLLLFDGPGSPDFTAFTTTVNTALATLLSSLIGSFQLVITQRVPNYAQAAKLAIDTDTAGNVIATPYQVMCFAGDTDATVTALANAARAANPSYWWGPIFYCYNDQSSSTNVRSMAFVLYNTVLANGVANWQPGFITVDMPIGPAGGDLSGTYPNPIVGPRTSGYLNSGGIPAAATVIDSALTAGVSDVEWEFELIKGATRYSSTLRANVNDGITPTWIEDGIDIGPPTGGTFDFTITCTIAGGNLNLVVTPLTVGWSMRYRSRVLAI